MRSGSIPTSVAAQLSRVPGVEGSALLAGGTATVGEQQVTLLGYAAGVPAATGITTGVADGQVLVSPFVAESLPKTVIVKGTAGKRELTVVASQLVTSDQAMVSSATLAVITTPVPAGVQRLRCPTATVLSP